MYIEGVKFFEGWNFGLCDEDVKMVEFIVDKMVMFWGDDVSWLLDGENYFYEVYYLKLDCFKVNM